MNFLRKEMERVWKELPCLSPLHLIRWNAENVGYWLGVGFSLSWTKGTLKYIKRKRRRLWRRYKGSKLPPYRGT